MAKEKNRNLDNSTVNDGSHAIHRFTIGDFLGRDYERSKLYDPAFETGYRKAQI